MKLRHISLGWLQINFKKSSPQQCKAWLEEADMFLQKMTLAFGVVLGCVTPMLILDVRTWWSSTHQMLHKFHLLLHGQMRVL